MATKAAEKKTGTPVKRGRPAKKKAEEAKIFQISTADKKGARNKEEQVWVEPYQCGDNASEIKVVCKVDCKKCTFKVTSHFTTKQFHIYNEDKQIDLLEKKAALELKAGRWGVERCQHWNELQDGGDPNQLKAGFPDQDDED